MVYTGLPGVGDAVVLAAAEADMVTLMSIRDPNEKMRLTAVDPPVEAWCRVCKSGLSGFLFS